jgi:hypothetical protein
MQPPRHRLGPCLRAGLAVPLGLRLGLLASLALLTAAPAGAGPLRAGGDHAGEDHSLEDHSGEYLRRIDLGEADLSGSDLSASDLKDAVLVDALLVDARLVLTVLFNADLTGADLTGADLTGAMAKNAVFADAVLDGAVLVGADLKNASFAGAMLLGADLSSVRSGRHADFDGAYYDARTLLDPSIDTTGMLEVLGICPRDPGLYLIDSDGDGLADTCQGAIPLPEPGGALGVVSGAALLLALRARRRPAG